MNKWHIYASLSAAGLVFVAETLTGLFAGQWLDGRLGTGAVFTLLLTAFGLLGAVFNLLRTLRRIVDGG